MRHVRNDATTDCICKVLSCFDYSSPDVKGCCVFEMERSHISGSLLICIFYSPENKPYVFLLPFVYLCYYVSELHLSKVFQCTHSVVSLYNILNFSIKGLYYPTNKLEDRWRYLVTRELSQSCNQYNFKTPLYEVSVKVLSVIPASFIAAIV